MIFAKLLQLKFMSADTNQDKHLARIMHFNLQQKRKKNNQNFLTAVFLLVLHRHGPQSFAVKYAHTRTHTHSNTSPIPFKRKNPDREHSCRTALEPFAY